MKRIGSTAQRLRELPYEKRVCRAEYYPICLPYLPPAAVAPDADQTIKEYVDIIHDVGLEVQVVLPAIDRGTPRFRSKMIPPHPHVDRDLLPRYLELAHDKGIIILGYYPVNYCKPLKSLHPEWLMEMLDDGRPPSENLGWFCFNSPYRAWLRDYLIEFLDNLDLDGFYFDDLNWGSHEKGPWYPSCCCRYCEKLFAAETGLEIPREVDFDSVGFRHFVNWRYDKFRDFILHLLARIKEKHPDAILEVQTYMEPTADWSLGHPLNPLHVEKVGAYLFDCTGRSLREPSLVAKTLRATGAPFSVFRNLSQTLEGFGAAPYAERFSAAVFAFSAIANGGQPCGLPIGHPLAIQKDTMQWLFTELKKRADYIEGDTVKYAALHYSQQSRDFRPSELHRNRWRAHRGELGQKDALGAYEMLNRSHLVLDFVLDEHLAEQRLSSYQVLFLSNSACLSEDQCAAIARFVENGGTLIATHETSLLDELGYERENFALAETLGVDFCERRHDGEEHGAVYLARDDKIREENGELLCFYGRDLQVALRPGAGALCTRSNLAAHGDDLQDGLSAYRPGGQHDTGEPAVVLNEYGRGRAIYIAGDVGGAFMNSPYPPLMRFVAGLVKRTPPPLEIEGPQALEVTAVRRPSGELMVHLINNPTPLIPWRIADDDDLDRLGPDMGSFNAVLELAPLRDIRVRFNGPQVNSVRMPLQGMDLAVEDGAVVVPEVKLHEVLLVNE
jgi:hypothetical protein